MCRPGLECVDCDQCICYDISFTTGITFLQPFALSASEKQVMKDLTDELFNLIPSSNDLFITDITDGML